MWSVPKYSCVRNKQVRKGSQRSSELSTAFLCWGTQGGWLFCSYTDTPPTPASLGFPHPPRFHSHYSKTDERRCWILLRNQRAYRILFLKQELCDHNHHPRDKTHGLSVHQGSNNSNRNNNNSSQLRRLLTGQTQTSSPVPECSRHPCLQIWKQAQRV